MADTSAVAPLLSRAIMELHAATSKVSPDSISALLSALSTARNIVVYGVGREGLALRGFAMRLHHLGLCTSVVGDMTTPPIETGDLFIVSTGPGHFGTVESLVQIARKNGASTVCFTANEQGTVPNMCDVVVNINARTMRNDVADGRNVLPMGSAYEGALFVVFEVVVVLLMDLIGTSEEEMRARHTNME